MTKPTPIEWDAIRKMITPDKIGFIVLMKPRRIGGLAFLTFLEHRHFSPVPLPSPQYELLEIHWEEMMLALCLIPASKRPEARAIAQELGLRFADGVPHIGSAKGWAHFPIDLPNLFTIENVPGHFAYRNNPAEQKTADDYELEAVNQTIQASVAKLKAYEQQKGARA